MHACVQVNRAGQVNRPNADGLLHLALAARTVAALLRCVDRSFGTSSYP